MSGVDHDEMFLQTVDPMAEQTAVRADAERRIAELRAVARTLWTDRADPAVQAELVRILGQLRQAEDALR